MLKLKDCTARLAKFKEDMGHQLGIKSLGIFGSVARQQNTDDSDLDIVVEMEHPTLRQMYEIETSLAKIFECKIDLVQMRPTLRPLLRQYIEKEAIYV